MAKQKGRGKNPAGCHIRKSTYDEVGAANSEDVVVSDERVAHCMSDDDMRKEGCADKTGLVDAECVGVHRNRKEEELYEICDLLGTF